MVDGPAPVVRLFSPIVLRRFLGMFLPVTGLLLAIAGVIYLRDVLYQRVILQQEAWSVLAVEQEFLARECRAVRADLLYLARQDNLERLASGDDRVLPALQREYAKFAESKAVYDQIRYLDSSGQEIIRINYRDDTATVVAADQLQAKADRYYYRQAMRMDDGRIFVSPFDLNVEHGEIETPYKPVIRFLTPVRDERQQRRGLLALNYLGGRLLANLRSISEGFVGDTMLVNQEGEYLLAPNPRHQWGWQLDHGRSFRRDFPAAWQLMRQREDGAFTVNGEMFTFQRFSATDLRIPRDPVTDASTVLLVTRVPQRIVSDRSRNLLRQLLLLFSGTLVVVCVLSLYWARSRVAHEIQEKQLAASEARLRQLSSQLLAAQEEERRRLSRELHDELGQQVTAISLDLKAAARGDVGPRSAARLELAIQETEQLLGSLHAIASRVRPSVLDDLGLADAVESFLAEYRQRTRIQVHDRLAITGRGIPPRIGENVYRILQEALANVAHHADTSEAWITIEQAGGTIQLTVRDHGRGFDSRRVEGGGPGAGATRRLGLLGMRERAELLDGTFSLETAPGKGTTIHVVIPLPLGEPASQLGDERQE